MSDVLWKGKGWMLLGGGTIVKVKTGIRNFATYPIYSFYNYVLNPNELRCAHTPNNIHNKNPSR